MPRRRDKGEERAVARERIAGLFGRASRAAGEGRPDLAQRYVGLARRIGMRYLVRLPREFRIRHCRRCSAYWVPGVNCRLRLRGGKVVATCRDCGAVRRWPYRREQAARRKRGAE